jgi:uncharacterized protein
MARIEQPVLLIASGGDANEIPTNRAYRDAGPSAELYEIPEAGHTAGLAARPAEYEARVTAFLGEVLGTDE